MTSTQLVALTPSELTSIGGLLLSAVALVVLPLVFRRQTEKQLHKQEERQEVKDAAERDAAAAAGTLVSWEKINQALSTSAKEERLAHAQRLVEMRDSFAYELERTRRRCDEDLDRAHKEIDRLGAMVRELEQRVGRTTEPPPQDH